MEEEESGMAPRFLYPSHISQLLPFSAASPVLSASICMSLPVGFHVAGQQSVGTNTPSEEHSRDDW